ncbi:MAG: PssD/Cps14F family polysaccharide biosynthesis glycosyltransferase [Culicoidibacterales bacterium]
MKTVMFISSGGGHISELKQLEPLFGLYNSVLIVEKLDEKLNIANQEFFLPRGTRKNLVRYLFVFAWLCLKSIIYFCWTRPDVIVTTGAHTAVPMCYLGALFRRKIIFIESIARVHSKSLTGKLIEQKCTHIFVQWKSMCNVYKNAIYVGKIL